ncbi:hypothetical protein L596_022719 [Steinernema carpocapsae]|uniref:Uncharacterized protein n=1 Tax=Steinernema carpocapsae TaxID=34508 RepID=A0A4U5MNU9_STECR|nr:hypothetical protein L596_022719 [Steinernema carpocapsae]
MEEEMSNLQSPSSTLSELKPEKTNLKTSSGALYILRSSPHIKARSPFSIFFIHCLNNTFQKTFVSATK